MKITMISLVILLSFASTSLFALECGDCDTMTPTSETSCGDITCTTSQSSCMPTKNAQQTNCPSTGTTSWKCISGGGADCCTEVQAQCQPPYNTGGTCVEPRCLQ